VILAIFIFAGVTYLIAWSPVFSVRSIETSGLPAGISAPAITAKTDIAIGEKLSRIEPRAIERNLQEISWISHVAIHRNWISGKVGIEITPRIPVGIFSGRAIDATGTLFEYPGKLPSGLPVVTANSPALGLAAVSLFTHLPTSLQDQTDSVNASGESAIASIMNIAGRQVKITWGSSDQLDLKVTVLKALLDLPENKSVQRIDLSAPHAPIVK
jgi:cell division septal protein FtsQ